MSPRPDWWNQHADDERYTRDVVLPQIRGCLAGGVPRSQFEQGSYNLRALELLDEEARAGVAAVEVPRPPASCVCPPGMPPSLHFPHCALSREATALEAARP